MVGSGVSAAAYKYTDTMARAVAERREAVMRAHVRSWADAESLGTGGIDREAIRDYAGTPSVGRSSGCDMVEAAAAGWAGLGWKKGQCG